MDILLNVRDTCSFSPLYLWNGCLSKALHGRLRDWLTAKHRGTFPFCMYLVDTPLPPLIGTREESPGILLRLAFVSYVVVDGAC
jgi:hypothetical protein